MTKYSTVLNSPIYHEDTYPNSIFKVCILCKLVSDIKHYNYHNHHTSHLLWSSWCLLLLLRSNRDCTIIFPVIMQNVWRAIDVFLHSWSHLCYTYTTGLSALPDTVYTHKPKSACICYVPQYPCRLIARQFKEEIRIYYIDRFGKFDYEPAHASRNHRYTYICQQKWVNSMESVESSYKRLNSCFFAIASFHKVYYRSKGLTFFLKQVSRVFRWSLIKTEWNTLV